MKEGVGIWFIIYCPKGNEEEMVHSCRNHMDDFALRDAFILTYACLKKHGGVWQTESKLLFPNYVFLESDQPRMLSRQLKQYREFITVLEDPEMLWPMKEEEERLLRSLCQGSHQIEVSRGYIHGGVTTVTEGPLTGKEAWIRKIDRHKRLARLAVPAMEGRTLTVGLEIVDKG